MGTEFGGSWQARVQAQEEFAYSIKQRDYLWEESDSTAISAILCTAADWGLILTPSMSHSVPPGVIPEQRSRSKP